MEWVDQRPSQAKLWQPRQMESSKWLSQGSAHRLRWSPQTWEEHQTEGEFRVHSKIFSPLKLRTKLIFAAWDSRFIAISLLRASPIDL
jgi:hypothetical protein